MDEQRKEKGQERRKASISKIVKLNIVTFKSSVNIFKNVFHYTDL